MLEGSNIQYDIDGRHQGISCGGIGIIDQMIHQIELQGEINKNLNLLKRHLSYHESGHILNITYIFFPVVAALRISNCDETMRLTSPRWEPK
jgi:hypothetical protein